MQKHPTIWHTIFGKIIWNKPLWLADLLNQTKHRYKTTGLLAVVFLVVMAIVFRFFWLAPSPELLQAVIQSPTVSENTKPLTPKPLLIHFLQNRTANLSQINLEAHKPTYDSARFGQLPWVSAAPIDKIGKTLPEGSVKMSIPIAGSWRWTDDKTLTFTPKAEWPAGAEVTVTLNRDALAPSIKLIDYHPQFETEALAGTVTHAYFYQDPKNVTLHQVVATLTFNYPMDLARLKKAIQLELQTKTSQTLAVEVTQSENHREAYLRTENIPLPEEPAAVTLIVNSSLTAAEGPGTLKQVLSRKVTVPDRNNIMKVLSVSGTIVRTETNDPKQVLLVNTSIGAKDADINSLIKAYLLPKDRITANSTSPIWESAAQVTDEVLVHAESVKLTPVSTQFDYATTHSFEFNVPEDRYLLVTIPQGVMAAGQYTLARPYKAIVRAPSYPRELAYVYNGSLLSLSSDRSVSVQTRGLPAVQFQVARLRNNSVNHLITQTSGNFQEPVFQTSYFNEENISETFRKEFLLNNDNPQKLQYASVNLNDYLPEADNKNALGLFLLTTQAWDPVNKRPSYQASAVRRLVLLTDMSIIMKQDSQHQLEVFVASITQGAPVAGAEVMVLGKNGLPVAKGITDEQGHIHFDSVQDNVQEKQPVAIVATKDQDLTFIPYDRAERLLNLSRFDISGIRSEEGSSELRAFLFSDRGLYRPGDTVHLTGIVKPADWVTKVANLPVKIMIQHAGTILKKEKFTLPSDGLVTADFISEATSPTGSYEVDLALLKENNQEEQLGSTTFSIEEFIPDTMRIHATFDPDTIGWLKPEAFKTEVTLTNLYGKPAQNHVVRANFTLAPNVLTFASLPDYQFNDPLRDPEKKAQEYREQLPEQKTDDQGIAQFSLPLGRFSAASYYLDFYAEGFVGEGGKSVKTHIAHWISPLDYLVGVKTDGDLSFVKQASMRKINLLAVDNKLKAIALSPLTLKWFEKQNVAVLTQQADKSYVYKTVEKSIEKSSQAFKIASSGTVLPLNTTKPGKYEYQIVASDGKVLLRQLYTVVGAGSQSVPKDALLSVKLDKPSYHPGEQMNIAINAPYEGAGLITIERDKVYAYQWVKLTGKSANVSMEVPNELMGNAYVQVAIIRDWQSSEVFMSPLSYSVAPFSIAREAQTVKIALGTSSQLKPSDDLKVVYHTNQKAKIVIFGVDEGILQVAQYATPDPMDFFFRKQALTVATSQTADQILPKWTLPNGSSVGGDMMDKSNARASFEATKQLNRFSRKAKAAVVFWSGILESDTTDQVFTYHLPDYFNGSLRIMAVAVSDTAAGSLEKAISVHGDLVLSSNYPLFMAPDDTAQVSLTVANQSQSPDPITVDVKLLASDTVKVIGEAKKPVRVNHDGEQTVQFTIQALHELGTADLDFYAETANKKVHVNENLSIRPPVPYTSTIQAGVSRDQSVTLPLSLDWYAQQRRISALAGTSPLILANGLQQYLNEYPYGCSEQIISRAMPTLAMLNIPSMQPLVSQGRNHIITALQALHERQLPDGSFMYWPGMGEQVNPEISLYAVHFLTLAKEQGRLDDATMLDNALSYLQQYSLTSVNNLTEAQRHSYAIYLLARNQIMVTNPLASLLEEMKQKQIKNWQSDLTAVYIAATYQMLQQSDEANALIENWKPRDADVAKNDDNFDYTTSSRYIDVLAKHFPERLSKVAFDDIAKLVIPLEKEQYNTNSIAYLALALADYQLAMPNLATNSLTMTVTDDKKDQQKLPGNQNPYTPVMIPNNSQKLAFTNSAKSPFFYQLSQAGFSRNIPNSVENSGIEVFRDFLDKDGKKVDKVTIGDSVQIEVRIRSVSKNWHNNIAIVDMIPGGFEVERSSVTKTDGYIDVREDRVLIFPFFVSDSVTTFRYRLKAIATGEFVVPAIYAESMYERGIHAHNITGHVSVVQ